MCTDKAHSACSVMSASDSFHYSCRAPEPLSTHPHTNTQACTHTHTHTHTHITPHKGELCLALQLVQVSFRYVKYI